MRLHTIRVKHCAQRGSHTAVETYLLANDEEEVVSWLRDSTCLEDWERDGDEGEVGPTGEWWDDNPEEADRAREMGLTIHLYDWGDREGQPDWVEGPKAQVFRWWRGDFDEPTDLYYGATIWSWDRGLEITQADAEVLLRLGIAIDVRQQP